MQGLSASEVKQRVDTGAECFILDTRSPQEFEETRLGIGETLIPLGALREGEVGPVFVPLRTILSTGTIIRTTPGDHRKMDTISYSAFRTRLASTLDKVNDDHTPILVTRQNGKPAVVMSLEDFHSYEETAYLMASPRNAERLNRAIAEVETGKIQYRELMEE